MLDGGELSVAAVPKPYISILSVLGRVDRKVQPRENPSTDKGTTAPNLSDMSFTFGAPQAAASTTPQTSSLFGNTASKPFSFGTPTQPAASTGQTGQPASGMFGQQPQTTQSSTGLFGQQTQNNAQQPASGSLFGSTPAQQPQSTSLFGSTNQQQPSTSLFGSTNTNTQQQPTSSLFGSTANANTTQQQSGGLFGNSTQPQTSSLFGSTAQKPAGGLFGSTNQPATQTSSLFGQQPQQQQQTISLFGNNAATGTQQQGTSSLFGQQSTAQPGGLFGQSNQAGQQSSLFGSTLGQPQQQQQQQQQQQNLGQSQVTQLGSSLLGQPKQEVDIGTRIQNVKNAWDTNHPDCRLKYYFYNVVEPGTAGQYGRPAGATDEIKWMRAQRENPDPSSMIPVLATGWNDVKKRVQLQEQMAAIHQARMKEINGALAELTRQTNLSSSIRLQQLQLQLTSLLHRLLRVVASLPNVNSVVSGGPETSRDIDTREKLIGVQNELDGKGRLIKSSHSGPIGLHTPKRRTGGGEGRLLGQVNELWGAIEELRRRRRGVGLNGDGEQFDKYQLDRIAEVLAQQQKALQALTELMKDALFDSDVMRSGLGIA